MYAAQMLNTFRVKPNLYEYVTNAIGIQSRTRIAILKFINHVEDVNSLQDKENSKTLFHWAAEKGQLDIMHLLIEKGIHINAIDQAGYSALHYAVKNKQWDVIHLLLTQETITVPNKEELKNLIITEPETTSKLEQVIDNPNKLVASEIRAKHRKFMNAMKPTLFSLITTNTDELGLVNEEDKKASQYDLLMKTFNEEEKIIKNIIHTIQSVSRENLKTEILETSPKNLLLFVDDNKKTLMHTLAACNAVGYMQELDKLNVDFNCKDFKGKTPLDYAIEHDNFGAALFLLDKIKPISLKSIFNNEAFFNVDMMRYSNESGMYNSRTYLDWRQAYLKQIIQYLLDKGVDINESDEEGNTPLHHLVTSSGFGYRNIEEINRLEVLKFLLEKGANIHVVNHEGLTPLQHGQKGNSADIQIQLLGTLVKHGAERSQVKETLRIYINQYTSPQENTFEADTPASFRP